MLCLIRDIVEQVAHNLDLPKTPKHKKPDRPKISSADPAKGILLAQYFSLSNRATQGYVLLFKEKLCLTALFSYQTIERAYGDMEVRQILQEIFELTNVPIKELEHKFGPDAIPLSTSAKQNYEMDRQKNQVCKGYEKILVMAGFNYKIISSFKFARNPTDHE